MLKKLWKRLFGPKYDFSKWVDIRYTEDGFLKMGSVPGSDKSELDDPDFIPALWRAIRRGKVKATRIQIT